MSNLKQLVRDYEYDYQYLFQQAAEADQLYRYHDTLERYVKVDIMMTEQIYCYAYAPLKVKVKPHKHNSAFRTVSDRKWAGHKRNKPKHNWGKKRKALMKVWLG